MKKLILILSFFFLTAIFRSPVFAVCAEGSSWTASWVDAFGQTTYTLEAPCKVYIGIPFNITATITDNTYLDDLVACNVAIEDNGTVIAGGKWWIFTVNGLWQTTIERTYTGIPVDHTIKMSFIDLGEGGGAHFWGFNLIGDITVDPYPPASNTPPAVNAGPDIFLTSDNQFQTVIQGTTADADGDALTFRWLEGDSVLQSSQPVDSSGNAFLGLSSIPPLSVGTHILTLEVTDGTVTVKDDVVVTVENSAPIAAPSGNCTLQVGETLSLNGSVSDYDGDTLSYRWLEGAAVLGTGLIQTPYGGSPVSLPELSISGLALGSHTLTLEIYDGIHIVTSNILVEVIDTVAPTLAPVASTNILWPPNGSASEVIIKANAHDNSGETVMLSVLVTSNQPSQTDEDGNIIPDYSVLGIDQSEGVIILSLRAARSGESGDRIYSVKITASDASGNSSMTEVLIKAPHDRGRF